MKLEVILKEDSIEIDNGHQYICVPFEDVNSLIAQLRDKLSSREIEDNLKIDWNFLGGL